MAIAAINDDMFTEDVIADPTPIMAASEKKIPSTGTRSMPCGSSPGTTMWWMTGTMSCSRTPSSETIRGRPIQTSMNRTWGCTSTSGITRLTSSSARPS